MARWLQKMQQYNFDVQHRPGREHANADTLSRRSCLATQCRQCDRAETKERTTRELERCPTHQEVVEQIRVVRTGGRVGLRDDLQLVNTPEIGSLQDIADAQKNDIDLGPIIEWIKGGNRPDWSVVSAKSKLTKTYWA